MENTAVQLILRASDWETLVSIMDNRTERIYQQMKFDLSTAWINTVPRPQGNTDIAINTKEKALLLIFDVLFGNTVRHIHNDTGGSSFERIMQKLRAKATATAAAGDTYLQLAFSARDSARTEDQRNFRKNGRSILMMESYDNN